MSTKQHLIVFAKAPEPGRVKTRLCWPPEQAAQLHRAFVLDVLERHRRPGRAVSLWRAGDTAHSFWSSLTVPQVDQPEGNLGAKLRAAFTAGLKDGDAVVIVGTDSPTLPPKLVDDAFRALESAPVVVGPACDGGYYLIGMRGGLAPVFPEEMPWGTEHVFHLTLELLEASGIHHEILDFWYDVDRPADLLLLKNHLPVLARTGIPIPERSVQCLRDLSHLIPMPTFE